MPVWIIIIVRPYAISSIVPYRVHAQGSLSTARKEYLRCVGDSRIGGGEINMEHIMISPGKMKLMLTKKDLDKYSLDCKTIDIDDSAAKKAFRELLNEVKRTSGFDAMDDKVFIQLYPSKDGGAEIYITKLTVKGSAQKEDAGTVRVSNVYAFDSLSEMMAACAAFGEADVPEMSSGWRGEGKYFLITESYLPYGDYLRGRKLNKCFLFIGFYGKIIDREVAEFYVKEHCLCFCEKNAVKMLGSMV